MGRLLDWFVRTTTADLQQIAPSLDAVDPAAWDALPESYRHALLEQYRLYVEMADRVSARRALTNTFFLTLNSAVFTLIGVGWSAPPEGDVGWLVFPLVALTGQCLAWYWLLRSYRQLNSAKYIVVGALEQRLPLTPYWGAEWRALGEGRIPSRYLPLTHLEQWVPLLFLFTYVIGFVAACLA